MKKNALALFLICLITAGALCLRLWNIDWSGPYDYHRDEPVKETMINDIAHGTHHIDYFKHPHFLLMSAAACVRVTEVFLGPQTIQQQTLIERRWVSVLAALTVFLTGWLGLRWRGAVTGIGAALFLAAVPLHVLLSRYIKEDIGLTFWLVLVFGAANALRAAPRVRLWFFLVGTTCGGALAAKWVGALVFVPVIFELRRRLKTERAAGRTTKRLVTWFILGVVSQFLLWHPWLFLDLLALGRDLTFSVAQSWQEHRGVAAIGFFWHLRYSLLPGMGVGIILLAIAGVVLALRKRFGAEGVLIAFFLLVIYVPTELSPMKSTLNSDRYMAGTLPFFALLGAATADYFAGILARRTGRRGIGILFSLALILLATAPALANSIAFSKNIVPDNRTLARKWMLDNIPPGSEVVLLGKLPQYYPQRLADGGLQVTSAKAVDEDTVEACAATIAKYDYVCVSSFDLRLMQYWPRQRKEEVQFYRWLFDHYETVKTFASDKPSALWPKSFSRPVEYGFDQPAIWILKSPATPPPAR